MGRTGVEYADEQISVYPAPCLFSCRYCWAKLPLWRYRLRNPHPIREAKRLAKVKKPKRIVVSFTGDPYQSLERTERLTRYTLEILAKTEHEILVLTKNPGFAVKRDLDLLLHRNFWLGSTLTSTRRIPDEPYAPGNDERIEAVSYPRL